MDLTTWLSLVAVCVMGAISPGPSLAVILRVSVSQSPLHGLLAAITHGLGIGFWAFLTLQGLAILMAKHQDLFSVLTVLGGVYLAWLGLKAWRYAGQGKEINVLNPKIALFFLALFSQLIPTNMDVLIKFQLWATVVVIDSGWYIIVALLLAGGPVLSWLRRHTVWVDRSMGGILMLLGLKVVIGAFFLS